MLMRILASLLFSLAFVTSCEHSGERKLIGTWESRSIDAAWRVTFKADHTLILAFEDLDSQKFEPGIPGTWRLDGSQLTTDVDLKPVLAMIGTPHEKPNSQKMTETVTFVGNDRIERTGGYPYIRVK